MYKLQDTIVESVAVAALFYMSLIHWSAFLCKLNRGIAFDAPSSCVALLRTITVLMSLLGRQACLGTSRWPCCTVGWRMPRLC